MPNGLFIRSYPAGGVSIIPTTFGAGVNGYFLGCFIPVWAIALSFVIVYFEPRNRWALGGLVASTIGLLIVVSLLRRLRLEIRSDGISYAGPFGDPRFTLFSEISTVVFIEHQQASSYARARRAPLSWTAIITPNLETGKPAVEIPLSFFSRSAYEELRRVLGPEVWESPA